MKQLPDLPKSTKKEGEEINHANTLGSKFPGDMKLKL